LEILYNMIDISLPYLQYFYLQVIYMESLEEVKSFFVRDLINKQIKRKYHHMLEKRRRKEKKRLLIEQIKKERQENSLIFNDI